jgi:DNA mismatch endonuclease (patch repair protein)
VPKQPFKKVERRLAGKAALRTDAATSARMSRIRQAGTEPEMTVRRAVSTLGLRYTVNNQDLPGSPDLANRSRRWAIFVHGCYWHRHTGCHKATTPRTNTEFWLNKFSRNVARDTRARDTLRREGYKVLTLWQCELDSNRKLSGKLAPLAAGACESTPPARTPSS